MSITSWKCAKNQVVVRRCRIRTASGERSPNGGVWGFYAWQYSGCPMKAGTLSESGRIRPHLTPLECGIIFGGIPEGAISRKVGLIWGIPAKTSLTQY